MTECFCIECSWSGEWKINCPECWGVSFAIDELEERAAIMEFSESAGEVSRERAEYWAVASRIRSKTLMLATKPEIARVLSRWKSFIQPAVVEAA